MPETTADSRGETAPRIALIAALAQNGVIGRDNQLPWHLPEDLRYFKAITLGKPIIIKRRTFESIGRPLPGRANIVVTSQPGWSAEGVHTAAGPAQALQQAAQIARREGVDEVVVIGGAELYRALLGRADRLYLTRIHADVEGDACFPAFDEALWREVSRRDCAAGEGNAFAYSFVVYDRGPGAEKTL
jgi:dihydrofolate reductase